MVDKRLGIELAALRQNLWRQGGKEKPAVRMLEDKPNHPTNIIRWIDTTVMLADCLTKAMRDTYLMEVIKTNVWNFAQTEEAKRVEARKQEQRRKTAAEKE